MRMHIDAVLVDELLPINIEVSRAVSDALGVAERMDALRAQIDALVGFDRFVVVNLRAIALAALYAHLVVLQREDDGEDIHALGREGAELRDTLRVAAVALAHRGLLSPERLGGIRRGRSRVQVASELIALRGIFREAWPRIAIKTSISFDEVERAGVLGVRLHAAAGARSLGPHPRGEPDDSRMLRNKAFTLMMRAYGECRRVVLYLRWHEGDADAYVPSLYRKRGRRRVGSFRPPPRSGSSSVSEGSPLVVATGSRDYEG
ncbi:MAG: hypothetical protein AAGF11_31205 [Myxococcota bacterium]